MTHWFHRNPIKASLPIDFEKRSFPTSTDSNVICSQLKQKRANLLKLQSDPASSLEATQNEFQAYVSLLLGFLNDYSGRSNGDSKLRFSFKSKWSQTLNTANAQEEQDAYFELASMMLNNACWLTKHAAYVAAILNEPSEKEAKEIHKSLRQAAGQFKFVQENLKNKLIKGTDAAQSRLKDYFDLTDPVLATYLTQCKAEAQEITIARAIELKHSPNLISSLAQSTHILFQAAYDGVKTLERAVIQKWALYLALKSYFYKSQAYCYLGLDLLSKDKCGDAIKALQESLKLYKETEKICAEYASAKGPGTQAVPERHQFFKNLGTIIDRAAEKCDRENGMIYRQKLPSETPALETKTVFGLAEPEEYVFPKEHELWTPRTCDSFDISKGIETKDKSSSDKSVPQAKEVPIPQGNAEPSSISGCNIS